MKIIGKEDQYVTMMRIHHLAVHGTWVDLYKNHLKFDAKSGRYQPDSQFSNVDTRALAPVAIVVLMAVEPYIERFFTAIPESRAMIIRIKDVIKRMLAVDDAHEKLMAVSE